ncbi:hypothetical protein I4U23_027249 [Adineta vaga]|nr:hypothetical protein I4U23_027249 [Adineta vaga]
MSNDTLSRFGITKSASHGFQAVLDALTPVNYVISEYYHLFQIIGAHMDEFKNSPLKIDFNSDEHLFEQTIWSPGDFSTYVGNIAITNILSTLLKTVSSEESTRINKSETIIIYSEKKNECGIIKLNFTGDQIKAKKLLE